MALPQTFGSCTCCQFRFNRYCLLLLFCLMFFLPQVSFATEGCLLQPLHPDQKFAAATLIVEGEVTGQQSFWDADHQNIYTSSQVTIYKVFKGNLITKTIQVITEGGTVNNEKHVFSATLQLKTGQQGIFYLQPDQLKTTGFTSNTFQVYGSMQGFIEYRFTEKTAVTPFIIYPDLPTTIYQELHRQAGTSFTLIQPNPQFDQLKPETNQRLSAPPLIIGFSPERLTAGTGSQLTINGLNFGNSRGTGSVEFRNANDGGATFIKPLDADYIKWTDTEIIVKVPSAGTEDEPAGTGTFRVTNSDPASIISPKSLLIDFAYSNVNSNNQSYSPDHTNDNGSGGYTFQFATGFNNNTAAKEAFIRSMDNWTCNTTMNWTADGITTINTIASDNINLVRFDAGNQLPAGVLGRCISRYRGCTSGGNTTYFVSELDLEFDDATNWQFGPAAPGSNQYDFETVTLHELGHGMQLGHIISQGAVMHFAIGRGQQNRSLNPVSDIGGGNFVINRSFTPNACGPGPLTPKTVTDCPLPQELVSFEAAFVPDSGVVLNWSTFRERNITNFHVERSPDAKTWTEIALVPAAGNTADITPYRTTDQNPLPVISYYRLRIQKADGSFLYSQIVEVITREVKFNTLEVLENPVREVLRFQYITSEPVTLTLHLYDTAGRLHQTSSMELNAGSNTTILPLINPGLGLYLLHWTDGKTAKTERIVKINN